MAFRKHFARRNRIRREAQYQNQFWECCTWRVAGVSSNWLRLSNATIISAIQMKRNFTSDFSRNHFHFDTLSHVFLQRMERLKSREILWAFQESFLNDCFSSEKKNCRKLNAWSEQPPRYFSAKQHRIAVSQCDHQEAFP